MPAVPLNPTDQSLSSRRTIWARGCRHAGRHRGWHRSSQVEQAALPIRLVRLVRRMS